jgi:pyrroline-5-carboxylate reductase
MAQEIGFIGGGNMATAIIGGLIRQGREAQSIVVIDPSEAQRAKLQAELGVVTRAAPDAALDQLQTIVWAVKPQQFTEAVQATGLLAGPLHFSVMAGIRSTDIAAAAGTPRVVRAMPNTPALIGRGITGLYAGQAVDAAARAGVEALVAPTGEAVWVGKESDLDAVTALSGSGPAYVFYFIEAMVEAGTRMGLTPAQSRQLAAATFAGASALVLQSPDEPAVLRERVTSKGGTTHAALAHLEAQQVKAHFVEAMRLAQVRAGELGDAFGKKA